MTVTACKQLPSAHLIILLNPNTVEMLWVMNLFSAILKKYIYIYIFKKCLKHLEVSVKGNLMPSFAIKMTEHRKVSGDFKHSS